LKTRKIDECREARVRLAFCLQMKHDVAVTEIAKVMGCSERQYLHWLKRFGLNEQVQIKSSSTENALQRLRTELNKLIDGEELPDKNKAEALMALAKAVKTVGELATETGASEVGGGALVPSLHEARQALARIDRRIDELAKRRAQEILGRGLDAKSDHDSGKRMAAQGA
jgi:DNA-directed RNA polymerase specialized sigma24 family protein